MGEGTVFSFCQFTPRQWGGGTPVRSRWGTPSQVWVGGTPSQVLGGYPVSGLGGTPSQVWVREEYPIQVLGSTPSRSWWGGYLGYCPPGQVWMVEGYPSRGYPIQVLMVGGTPGGGVPQPGGTPSRSWWWQVPRYPPLGLDGGGGTPARGYPIQVLMVGDTQGTPPRQSSIASTSYAAAVCLLRSRRRTFSFQSVFSFVDCDARCTEQNTNKHQVNTVMFNYIVHIEGNVSYKICKTIG